MSAVVCSKTRVEVQCLERASETLASSQAVAG